MSRSLKDGFIWLSTFYTAVTMHYLIFYLFPLYSKFRDLHYDFGVGRAELEFTVSIFLVLNGLNFLLNVVDGASRTLTWVDVLSKFTLITIILGLSAFAAIFGFCAIFTDLNFTAIIYVTAFCIIYVFIISAPLQMCTVYVLQSNFRSDTRNLFKIWGFNMWSLSMPLVIIGFRSIVSQSKVYTALPKLLDIYVLMGFTPAVAFLVLVRTAEDYKEHQRHLGYLSVQVITDIMDGVEMLSVIKFKKESPPEWELQVMILFCVALLFCLSPVDVFAHNAELHLNDGKQLLPVWSLMKIVCMNSVLFGIRTLLWWSYEGSALFCFKNIIFTIISLNQVCSALAQSPRLRAEEDGQKVPITHQIETY